MSYRHEEILVCSFSSIMQLKQTYSGCLELPEQTHWHTEHCCFSDSDNFFLLNSVYSCRKLFGKHHKNVQFRKGLLLYSKHIKTVPTQDMTIADQRISVFHDFWWLLVVSHWGSNAHGSSKKKKKSTASASANTGSAIQLYLQHNAMLFAMCQPIKICEHLQVYIVHLQLYLTQLQSD